MLQQPLAFAHELLKKSIATNDTVVDATVGNGNDTLLLATLVGEYGKVYGFDIQEQAIETTKKKLLLTGQLQQTELIHDGHENIDKYLASEERIGGATFNLGYLPKGDKQVITKPETTLTALKQCLKRLRKGGIITVMIYYGHDGGLQEKEQVDQFVLGLPQEDFNVLAYKFINQKNQPPYLYAIEKR